MISGTEQVEQAAEAPRGPAPPMPIEERLVESVLALSSAQAACERALCLLRFCPRDGAAILPALHELEAHASTALRAYAAFHEIRSCKGSA